jgi:hypothetical protein
MELNQQTIEEIYKEIRSHKDYMKHAKLQNEYKRRGQWAKAALEGKILKDMEQAVWAEVAKQYIDRTQITMDVVASMSDEDRHKMNILANSIVMLADVLDNLVMDTDSILKKYVSGKNTEFDKLKSALSESKGIVSYFDNKIADEKAASMFGDCSDNLYKLVFNKASSYVSKLKKYEESVAKKTTRKALVEQK